MFRVSPQDIRQVLAMTLGGSVLFAGLALGNLYTKKKLIEPEFAKGPNATKHVQKHDSLCSMLVEGEQQVISKATLYVAYLRMVHSIDRFIDHYETFRTKRTQGPQTQSQNEKWRQDTLELEDAIIKDHMTPFLSRFAKDATVQEYHNMEQLFERVKSTVHQYVQNVWTLTS